jgi:hypothetical protein
MLLIAGFVGWKWKATNDDGEIRGLRATAEAAAERLELAREKYQAVVSQVNELNDIVAQQDYVIADFKKVPELTPVPLNELAASNTEIKKTLTDLSTSTTTLGQALGLWWQSARDKTLRS